MFVSAKLFRDPSNYSAEHDQDMIWAVQWINNREPTLEVSAARNRMPRHSECYYVRPGANENPYLLSSTTSTGDETIIDGPWCVSMQTVSFADMAELIQIFFEDYMGIGKPQRDGSFTWSGNPRQKFVMRRNRNPNNGKSWTSNYSITLEVVGKMTMDAMYFVMNIFGRSPFLIWSGELAVAPSEGVMKAYPCGCANENEVQMKLEQFEQARLQKFGMENTTDGFIDEQAPDSPRGSKRKINDELDDLMEKGVSEILAHQNDLPASNTPCAQTVEEATPAPKAKKLMEKVSPMTKEVNKIVGCKDVEFAVKKTASAEVPSTQMNTQEAVGSGDQPMGIMRTSSGVLCHGPISEVQTQMDAESEEDDESKPLLGMELLSTRITATEEAQQEILRLVKSLLPCHSSAVGKPMQTAQAVEEQQKGSPHLQSQQISAQSLAHKPTEAAADADLHHVVPQAVIGTQHTTQVVMAK